MKLHPMLVLLLALVAATAGHLWRRERDDRERDRLRLEADNARQRADQLDRARAAAARAVRAAEEERDRARAAAAEAAARLEEERATNDPLRRELEQLAGEVTRLRGRVELHAEELRATRLESARQIAELRRSVEQANVKAALAEQNRIAVAQALAAAERVAAERAAELEAVRAERDTQRAEMERVREEVRRLQQRLEPTAPVPAPESDTPAPALPDAAASD